MKRIDALTPEQTAAMAGWRDKWIKIGLSTEPADRPQFEAAARECYGFAGLSEPKRFVWVDSPLALACTAPALAREVDGPDAPAEPWHRYLGGSLWPGWHAWRSFFIDVCGLEVDEDIAARSRAYGETIQSAYWWWPHREFCVVSERPRAIHLDAEGRLHSETGPAIVWPDGWGVYSWHGVRVAREVICEPITSAQIDNEGNAEVRRVMLERYGSARYLRDGGGECIDRGKDPSGQVIELWRKGLPGDEEPLCMLAVIDATPQADGTRKEYLLGVPPTMRTASEALAWTWDLPEADYRPTRET